MSNETKQQPKYKMYTRTGDNGYTALIGKGRVPKYDLRPEAYGQVDELQAALGLCRAGSPDVATREELLTIERDLYHMMAELATGPGVTLNGPTTTAERVTWLEQITDGLSQKLPPIKAFVLPGDTEMGARVHMARTVARRTERAVVQLMHEGDFANEAVVQYLNRLSSYLFTLACLQDLSTGADQPTFSKDA